MLNAGRRRWSQKRHWGRQNSSSLFIYVSSALNPASPAPSPSSASKKNLITITYKPFSLLRPPFSSPVCSLFSCFLPSLWVTSDSRLGGICHAPKSVMSPLLFSTRVSSLAATTAELESKCQGTSGWRSSQPGTGLHFVSHLRKGSAAHPSISLFLPVHYAKRGINKKEVMKRWGWGD